MANQPKVTIIIPVVRPDRARQCVEAIHLHAGVPDTFYVVDTEEDVDRIGCPRMVNRMVARAATEWVMFLGDDTLPCEGFLKNAWAAGGSLADGWGLVSLNDHLDRGTDFPAHWMGHKNLLPFLGGQFFHEGYSHCFCDRELGDRCRAMDRFVCAKDAVIFHAHPLLVACGVDYDEHYARAYNYGRFVQDAILYRQRKRKGWK